MPEFTVAVLTNQGGAHLDGYFTGLAQTEQATRVVVADPSGASESLAKKLLGSKLHRFERDFQKCLAEHKPGLAVVTLEAVQGPPAIQAALDANCHVLAEKPACVTAADFEPLAQLAEMKHRHLMLAMANRTRNSVHAAKRLIRTGQIGQIYGSELHLIADQTRLVSPAYHKTWFADRARAGGGHLIWLGIHWIDLIMFLTDSQIIETAGFTGIVGGQPLKAEDSAAMALRFDNGTFGTMTSGYYLDRGKQMSIRIWGSKGWLELSFDEGEGLKWYSTAEPSPSIKKYDGAADDGTYTPFIQACVRASIDEAAPPPITPTQSLNVLKTIFACYRAAESGRSQSVFA
ncbi:Gfo/Idh/MocA family protein [Schlesneria paludicola]|uniref:Gfo/Idh/MocA family protein n=1 Tax=Schlesneria paludicola TaxID=360056 RepID=UPI00029A08DF|nr:Gfo/Idh/MocA family oxidoreductase [Schlesneria paludicola]